MISIMIFAIPLLIIVPLFVMILFCYPVRKKDDVVIIGYPIYCKKYHLSYYDFNFEIERFSSSRGGSWAVVIRVYQKNTKVLKGKHVLPGHFFLKNATKELKKAMAIIFSS